MTYQEQMDKATQWKIMLKGRARDRNGDTPFDIGCHDISKLTYVHNLDNKTATTIVCYDGEARIYTYVCSDIVDCVDMISVVSKQMDLEYTEAKANEILMSNELLF